MAEQVILHSPLEDWGAAFARLPADVRIAELPFLTQLDVRAEPDGPAAVAIGKALGGDLPTLPCTAVRIGELDVLWLGPDEWLLVADPGRQRELTDLVSTAIGSEPGAVVDVSAQRTALSVSGPAARAVLARGCAIDLDPRVAPLGTCVQTLVARTGVTILVRDNQASDYLLLVRASFVDYLAAWLVDSTTDL